MTVAGRDMRDRDDLRTPTDFTRYNLRHLIMFVLSLNVQLSKSLVLNITYLDLTIITFQFFSSLYDGTHFCRRPVRDRHKHMRYILHLIRQRTTRSLRVKPKNTNTNLSLIPCLSVAHKHLWIANRV